MTDKLRLFEMFAGYGGASFALKKAGIDFECVGFSEIDKYAVQCFTQNHQGYHYGDCTAIDPNKLPDFDLLTGGFPCQSFSVAGKGQGELDTRGTLFHEIIRIAEVKRPRYMLLENVKGLTTKRHKETFAKILSELDRIGYSVTWAILNSREHGIPQNRERVFFICFRDAEDWKNFKGVPGKEELKIFIGDILEGEVDKKYYLSKEQVDKLYLRAEANKKKGLGFGMEFLPQGKVCSTLTARDYKEPKIYDVYNNRVKQDGVCITLTEPHHNNLRLIEPFIAASRSFPRKGSKAVDGERHQQLEPRKDGCTNTITTVQKDNYLVKGFSVRKLTPKEYFRLMGFLNDEINLEGLSNTQRYKLAGNGWDINLVSKILKEMINGS